MKDYLNYTGDFSKLSRKDLEYLFILLQQYQLKYRDTLGLDERISFGTELEFEHVLLYYVKKEMSKNSLFKDWFVHEDKSCSYKIDGFEVGGEVSSPILHDTKLDWHILSEVILTLQKLKAHVTDNTSLHVHVGAQIFGEEIKNVIRFIKVWCIFEAVIFKFAYGKSSTPRSKILDFAHPIAEETLFKSFYSLDIEAIIHPKEFAFDKTKAVNFNNYHYLSNSEEINHTIEIRCANGLLQRNMIQNTINFYLKLMLYVISDQYDEQLINRLFARLKVKDFSTYQNIYIKDALLLADLIFDNSLDKINFLKQYVKKDEVVFVR